MKRPTSVALRYDDRLPAPLIVARGRGELAERLVQIAVTHDVPVVEASELAESLVAVEPGFLPEAFYQAVAEVLSFVWHASRTGGNEKKVWDEKHQGQ